MYCRAICSSQVNETDEMKGRVLPSVRESGIIDVRVSSHASQSPVANYIVTECTEFKTWQVFCTNRTPLRYVDWFIAKQVPHSLLRFIVTPFHWKVQIEGTKLFSELHQKSDVYWTVHLYDNWRMKKNQLDVTFYFLVLLIDSTCRPDTTPA
jgi:hypothetical protein